MRREPLFCGGRHAARVGTNRRRGVTKVLHQSGKFKVNAMVGKNGTFDKPKQNLVDYTHSWAEDR
jgi:hypothetical protein